MDAQSPELDIPQAVGPFRVIRVLGQGGAGVVCLGEREEHFSQRVAIKFLNLVPSSGDAPRLDLEEQVLTALDHPGIVRLLDKGQTSAGLRYLVMEYVEGAPLDEYCDGRRLSLASRIGLLIQVLDAIAYAHRHFVIHADIKPANILVTAEGQPRLLDFGTAAMSAQKQQTDDERPVPLRFTPAFASPEQRRGERIAPASDIYSLAMVASVVLAGKEAHTGDLESILRKGLRPEPDKRYLSADEFAGDLRAFLECRPVSARHGSRMYQLQKWMLRHRLAASVSALLLAISSVSVIGVVVQAARASRQRAVAQAALHDLVRLTGTLDGELYGSVEPLPQSEKARDVLLQGAKSTLDELAKNSEQDPALALELARQYEALARLHLGVKGPGNRQHRREAIVDLDRADALLSRFSEADSRAVALRQQMLSLRQAAAEQGQD